jgi:uncharacterized membrane protein (UPF0127 family)
MKSKKFILVFKEKKEKKFLEKIFFLKHYKSFKPNKKHSTNSITNLLNKKKTVSRRQIIINLKNKKTVFPIFEKIKICKNTLSRLKGLMFNISNKKKNFAYLFFFKKKVKHSIHMLFVFYAIDIVFLNEKSIVVEKVSKLKPFRYYFPKNEYTGFIELQQGFIEKNKIKTGDKFSIFLAK